MFDWKDVLIRSYKTFVEAVVAFALTHMAGVEIFEADNGVWLSLLLSAVAAGVAAVWNGIIRPLLKTPE